MDAGNRQDRSVLTPVRRRVVHLVIVEPCEADDPDRFGYAKTVAMTRTPCCWPSRWPLAACNPPVPREGPGEPLLVRLRLRALGACRAGTDVGEACLDSLSVASWEREVRRLLALVGADAVCRCEHLGGCG